MSSGTAPRALSSHARAEASRRDGAKSRGPKTPQGKARSAQNALKHGLCAQKHVLLCDEDAQALAALEAAVFEELAPSGGSSAPSGSRPSCSNTGAAPTAISPWR